MHLDFQFLRDKDISVKILIDTLLNESCYFPLVVRFAIYLQKLAILIPTTESIEFDTFGWIQQNMVLTWYFFAY